MKPLYLFFLFTFSNTVFCQEFSFNLFFEDAAGYKDTLIIGYDSTATDSLDILFGEGNLIDVPLDPNFDVRISNEWFNRNFQLSPGTYHCKKQIVKSRCENWNYNYITIDIYSENWPVTASWDSSLFETPCHKLSFFTSINPGGWWDTGSLSNLDKVEFNLTGNVTFTSNIADNYNPNYSYINDNYDTIPVFWKAFYQSPILSVEEEEWNSTKKINMFPNPASDYINYKLKSNDTNIKSIILFNAQGKEQDILYTNEQINIKDLNSGIYIVQIVNRSNKTFTHKIIIK